MLLKVTPSVTLNLTWEKKKEIAHSQTFTACMWHCWVINAMYLVQTFRIGFNPEILVGI